MIPNKILFFGLILIINIIFAETTSSTNKENTWKKKYLKNTKIVSIAFNPLGFIQLKQFGTMYNLDIDFKINYFMSIGTDSLFNHDKLILLSNIDEIIKYKYLNNLHYIKFYPFNTSPLFFYIGIGYRFISDYSREKTEYEEYYDENGEYKDQKFNSAINYIDYLTTSHEPTAMIGYKYSGKYFLFEMKASIGLAIEHKKNTQYFDTAIREYNFKNHLTLGFLGLSVGFGLTL